MIPMTANTSLYDIEPKPAYLSRNLPLINGSPIAKGNVSIGAIEKYKVGSFSPDSFLIAGGNANIRTDLETPISKLTVKNIATLFPTHKNNTDKINPIFENVNLFLIENTPKTPKTIFAIIPPV